MLRKMVYVLSYLLGILHFNEVGALDVKTSTASAEKWNTRAAGAATEMATNAAAKAEKWATETAKAADTFQQAISSGNIKQRFARGVAKAGAEKFRRKVTELAQTRYSTGVTAAQTDYESGVSPYLQTLSSLTLSARKPRGDPSNIERVRQVNTALNAKRMSMLGGTS